MFFFLPGKYFSPNPSRPQLLEELLLISYYSLQSFSVKPFLTHLQPHKSLVFSEAEMAALAAPGGDDDDISAALVLGSSRCCLHKTGSGRRRRRGRGAERSRPSAPSPGPHHPPAPGHRRPSRRPPTPHGSISVPEVPGPRCAAGSRRQGRGQRGVKKLLTPGAEGGWKGA